MGVMDAYGLVFEEGIGLFPQSDLPNDSKVD
jgi:hypothetical protein